jgi:hypothetical protein
LIGLGSDLLRMLGFGSTPGVERSSGGAAGREGRVAGADFGTLLEQARAGSLSSGRTVTIGRGAGVSLSDEQIARVSAAADRAESQGATSALVMIDGMALKLDLTMREVTGKVNMEGGGVLTGVDAVVSVPGPKGKPEAIPLPQPGAGWGNASLLGALSKGGKS